MYKQIEIIDSKLSSIQQHSPTRQPFVFPIIFFPSSTNPPIIERVTFHRQESHFDSTQVRTSHTLREGINTTTCSMIPMICFPCCFSTFRLGFGSFRTAGEIGRTRRRWDDDFKPRLRRWTGPRRPRWLVESMVKTATAKFSIYFHPCRSSSGGTAVVLLNSCESVHFVDFDRNVNDCKGRI